MTRVFLKQPNGKNVTWDGRQVPYGDQTINSAWIAAQQKDWAKPGSSRDIGTVRALVYADGAIQLDVVGKSSAPDFRKQWFFPFRNPTAYKIDTCHGDSLYPVKYANYHSGWDINGVGGGNTDQGDEFLAIADGQVVFVSDDAGGAWGGLTVIAHPQFGPNVYSRYGHHLPGSARLRVGDIVRGGETVVAKVGRGKNNAYWAHLHLDVMQVTPGLSRSGRIWWGWWPNNNLNEFNRVYLNPAALFKGVRCPSIPCRGKPGVR